MRRGSGWRKEDPGVALYNSCQEGTAEGDRLCSREQVIDTRGNGFKQHQGGFDWILRKISSLKELSSLAQTAQDSGGVTAPGRFKNTHRCGMWARVSGRSGSAGLLAGLDLKGLFQPKQLCGTMILYIEQRQVFYILYIQSIYTLYSVYREYSIYIIEYIYTYSIYRVYIFHILYVYRVGLNLLDPVVLGVKEAPRINPEMTKIFSMISPQWLLSELILKLICNPNYLSLFNYCILQLNLYHLII